MIYEEHGSVDVNFEKACGKVPRGEVWKCTRSGVAEAYVKEVQCKYDESVLSRTDKLSQSEEFSANERLLEYTSDGNIDRRYKTGI